MSTEEAKRPIVVVDVETTGLHPEYHHVIEVAWWNLDTDEHGEFIPRHEWADIARSAQPEALRINRYLDRIHGKPQDEDKTELRRLVEQLNGARMAGSNPRFDYAFLAPLIDRHYDNVGVFEPHHRLLDLSAYAAGVMHMDPHEMPGLAKVCDLLQVDPPDHSAAGDVRATGECLKALIGTSEVPW